MRRTKKYLAMFLALLMLSGTFSVFAASEAPTYTSGNYKAVKISHPDAGIGEADGLIEYESGENDAGQNYSWSAVGYGDWMYIGTCYAAMWQTLKIMAIEMGLNTEQIRALMNVAFNGSLYVGDPKNNPEDVNRSVIVKINSKTGETKIVEEPQRHGGYRAATVFKDKLYFIGTGAKPFLLEIDPNNNDKTTKVYEADPVTVPGIATGIRGITEVNGKLAVTMIGNDGAFIVASENPSLGKPSFKTIATQQDLFDYPANRYMDDIFGGSIWDMVALNGKLYISIVTGRQNHKQPFALVCGEEQSDGTWKYHAIAGDPKDGAKYPFGFGSDRSGAGNLVVYKNQLYVGGYNDPMKALPAALSLNFEPMYKDLSSPVCLWRMDENESFEMVAGEANEIFPEGPVGNMGAGFGNALNQYVWRMQEYDGKLFVGTFDIGSLAYPLMQFTNGDLFTRTPEEWKSQIEYIKTFIDLIKGNEIALPRTMTAKDVKAAAADVKTVEALAEKGGASDIASTEKFYNSLKNIYKIYAEVKPILPKEITDKLDTILDESKIDNFYYFLETCRYLSKGERGFDLLVSEDGKNFDVITRNGFGDPHNHGLRTFAVTDGGLCIGTANPFYGTQVWRLDELKADKPTEEDKTEPDVTDPEKDPDKSDNTTVTDDKNETGKTDDKTDIPDTGDNGIAVGMAVLAVIACGVAVKARKKEDE